MSKEKETEKDTFTLEELAELLHTTPEEIERRSKEAIEIGKRKEKERNAIQKKIEKEIVIDKKKNQRKKGKKQIREEIIKELKTEGIKASPTTHSLVYRVVKPSEENPKYTEDLFLLGEELLQNYVTERKRLDKLLKKLLKDNEKQMNELFELVGATDEQKEKYLEALESDTELSEDLYFDIFGKSIEDDSIRIKGTPDKITKELLEARTKAKQEDIDEVVQMVKDRNLNDGQTKHFFEETIKFLNISDNPTFTIKEKVIDFGNVKPKEIVSLLDEQMELNKRAIEGMQIASKINLELMDLSNRFSVFVKSDDESIFTEEDERQLQLYVGISEEIQNSMKTYNSFTQLAKKKNPSGMFAKSYLEEKEKENETLKKLKEEILKQEEESQKAIEESQHNFKDIKMKTQAISVYKPYTKIFLRSEEITKYFEKWDSVTLPFGLKVENQNEVKYNITKWNYEHTDKDLKYYNACISTQWNLLKNNYPINTFIEEVALYQIYKGDDTFTYKPSTKELEEMKEALLGMNSNQAKMTFDKNYSYLKEKQKLRYTTEGTILPVKYDTYEIEGKNGRKYSKKGYIFSEPIPLFSFFNDIGQINTAPLKVESILQNSSMNDEITRIMKELIAHLYYFSNNSNNPQGYERKVYITEEGEELSLKKWNERKIDLKKEKKKLKGYWAYKTRRTIDSLIKDCKFVINKKGGQRIVLKEGEEKSLDTKTKQRFIDSIIKFLRESKNIPYTEKGTYIKDFILYDNKDKIIEEEDYFTKDDKKNLKKEIKEYCQNQMNRRAKNESFTDSEYKKELKKLIQAKEKKEIKRNPTISKIDIYIS